MRRDDVHPPLIAVRAAVATALAEDLLPVGDLTATLLPAEATLHMAVVARSAGIVAGTACVGEVCAQVDPALAWSCELDDGSPVPAGGRIGRIAGPMRSLVTAERTALNFLCHLSGIATAAHRLVEAVAEANPATRIWDTRKTTPGLRTLEKAAVRAGGAANHRGNLSEAILVKDNHLGGMSIDEAVARARQLWPGRMIEVECDRIEQVSEAVQAGATLVMCDNMTPDEVREACGQVLAIGARRVLVEASGGITLDNVAEYARAGADVISIGAMTHSAPILDIGLDLEA